jgi:hypothetical protein
MARIYANENYVHAGIIVCTEDSDFQALAARIHEAISIKGGDLEGQLIRVNRPNIHQANNS